jgi:hypothetical protein
MYIPKFRMCTTFILSPTAFTDQDGLIIPSRSIKKIATVCAEDKRADRRHRGKQVGGICFDLNLNFNFYLPDNRSAQPLENYSAGSYRQLFESSLNSNSIAPACLTDCGSERLRVHCCETNGAYEQERLLLVIREYLVPIYNRPAAIQGFLHGSHT